MILKIPRLIAGYLQICLQSDTRSNGELWRVHHDGIAEIIGFNILLIALTPSVSLNACKL